MVFGWMEGRQQSPLKATLVIIVYVDHSVLVGDVRGVGTKLDPPLRGLNWVMIKTKHFTRSKTKPEPQVLNSSAATFSLFVSCRRSNSLTAVTSCGSVEKCATMRCMPSSVSRVNRTSTLVTTRMELQHKNNDYMHRQRSKRSLTIVRKQCIIRAFLWSLVTFYATVIAESYYIQNQHHMNRLIYYSKATNPNASLGLYIASYTDVL